MYESYQTDQLFGVITGHVIWSLILRSQCEITLVQKLVTWIILELVSSNSHQTIILAFNNQTIPVCFPSTFRISYELVTLHMIMPLHSSHILMKIIPLYWLLMIWNFLVEIIKNIHNTALLKNHNNIRVDKVTMKWPLTLDISVSSRKWQGKVGLRENETNEVNPQKSRHTCVRIQGQPVEAVCSFTYHESVLEKDSSAENDV